MDKITKEILNRLCAGTIDVHEAAEALGTSVERIFELLDQHTYVPTSDEVIEACKIELETIGYIKQVALRKQEPRVPDYESFVDPHTSMRVHTMLLRKYKVRRKMRPTQIPREPFFERFEKKAQREETPSVSKHRPFLVKTPAYVSGHERKQFSTFNEQKIIMGA
jgi:transposase